MARIEPLVGEDLAEHEQRLAMVEAAMGFVPNSMPTMARVPGLLEAFSQLGRTVLYGDLLPHDLTQLIALVASSAAGCRYCQAHTGHTAERLGVSEEKLADVWSFETSDLYGDDERAALRLAFHAGQVPNAVTDEDFAEAGKYFSDQQVTAIVAVCALFGYLNRWNDTMATTLEQGPAAFGGRVLAEGGWEPGKHR